jgi:hypothetical protein
MHLHAQQNTEACNVVTSSKLRLANLSGVRDKSEIMLGARSSAQGLHAKCRRGRLGQKQLLLGDDRREGTAAAGSRTVFGRNLSQFDMRVIRNISFGFDAGRGM